MPISCSRCGSPIAGRDAFCTQCGTPRANPAAVETVRDAPASLAKSPRPLLKFASLALLLLALTLFGIAKGVSYLVHSAKQKLAASVAKLDQTANNRNKPVATKADAANTAKQSASSAPDDIPALTDVSVISPADANRTPIVVTGEEVRNWALKYERTESGPEADLVVRTGDINNLGFGWDPGFDPFSGKSTLPHFFPWTAPVGEPDGTDRIMVASLVTPAGVYRRINDAYKTHDGYSETLLKPCCAVPQPNAPPTQARLDTLPRPITVTLGALPAKIDTVVFQIFVDDFQPAYLHSHFQVTLNGTRIPPFEDSINALDQTGPIGKLITLRLLPEYWPLLQSGKVQLLIDDPTTGVPDGYAIDFVRILVNPHPFKYQVSLVASVIDADKHTPIPSATVTAALKSTNTDDRGQCQLNELPAGLVLANAIAEGYDSESLPVDLVTGQTGKAVFRLHRHDEQTAALERAIAQTGSAALYGIHFDTDSAMLRPDSEPTLNAVLGLINSHPGSRWIIAGHTDNQGGTEHNQPLSEARASAVVSWLTTHGISQNQLVAQGFGATRPVADNATPSGRALNRRVEITPVLAP
jgi:OmpA-OmpF porin, OOP family